MQSPFLGAGVTRHQSADQFGVCGLPAGRAGFSSVLARDSGVLVDAAHQQSGALGMSCCGTGVSVASLLIRRIAIAKHKFDAHIVDAAFCRARCRVDFAGPFTSTSSSVCWRQRHDNHMVCLPTRGFHIGRGGPSCLDEGGARVHPKCAVPRPSRGGCYSASGGGQQ